jgi:hypothetical protein
VRQLEYTPRAEPVIKIETKKDFVQPLTFGDTKAITISKVALPQWGDIFNRINQEEYPEYIPHNYPYIRTLNEHVILNIQQSYLHMVASRTMVFPYIEVLKWLIDYTDENK